MSDISQQNDAIPPFTSVPGYVPGLRAEMASRILAGFAANPAIFAHNDMYGWGLVNCRNEDIARYALDLASHIIAADKLLSEREAHNDGS